MNWLLRFFPQWAEAQARIAALEEECRRLERQALAAEARVEDLRKVANSYSRMATGRSVFAEITDLTPPSVEPPRPVMGVRKLGREIQMEREAEFRRMLLDSDDNQVA